MKHNLIKLLFIAVAIGQMAFLDFAFGPSKNLDLANVKRISRACYLIQHEYYDKSRIKPRAMLEEGFFELAKEVPEILPQFSGDTLTFKLGAQITSVNLAGLDQFYNILYSASQVFNFIHDKYTGDIKPEDMEYAFISGMLSVLDPHSVMLPPKAYEEFKTQTSGQYGGLGIVIGEKEGQLTVIAPIEDTPAWRAGVKTDDAILQIGDQSTANMLLSDAVDLMRGPPRTKVTLKLQAKSGAPRDVELTREIIVIKSVQSKIVEQNGKKIGVIRIKSFQEDTYEDMDRGLNELAREAQGKLKGYVLDLRNNPGGLLDQSIMIADRFLAKGDIVYTETADESDEDVAAAKKQDDDVNLPLVVLINEGSASASEIVAGALKNTGRALVLGRRSFGKGSVQSLFSLRDGSSIKLTVAQYLTPGRVSIQAEGIVPDIELFPALVKKDAPDLRADHDFSEKKLDYHLENAKRVKAEKPLHELTYFKKDIPPEESQYTAKIREADDYELMLAARILAGAELSSKMALITRFKDMLAREFREQDNLIAGGLKDLGIDWSQGTSREVPQVALRWQFTDDKGIQFANLKASQSVKFKAWLKNTGNAPLYRVLAETEALNPLIDGKELVFGKIAPGEEVAGEFAITVPDEIVNFREEATLNIYTAGTPASAPVKKMFLTHFVEKESPHLAYAFQVNDGSGGGARGDGDGMPEAGEKIVLNVAVVNLGPGTAEKTVVNLQNTEGEYVFLDKAREVIGELKPSAQAKAELKFDIKDGFNKDEFTIKLFAVDDKSKAGIVDTLKFSLKNPVKASPASGVLQVIPRIEVAKADLGADNRYNITAKVDDQIGIKDIAVFVKGRKMFYDNLQNENAVKTKTINVALPLEDGLNSIVIQARGDRELISQKSLSVVYHDVNKIAVK